MSEIKDELEHFAKELNIQDEAEAETPPQDVSKEDTVIEDNIEDAYLKAPSNYQKEFAETFATLPPKWREYLHIREQEVDKGFQELRNRAGDYKWLDDAYASRSDELKSYGINSSKEWMNNLAKIDALFSHSPQDAIKLLADAYNVKLGPTVNQAVPNRNFLGQSLSSVLAGQVVQKQVEDFAKESDASGNPKHPYFKEVVKDIYDLLQKGVANNLDDAYETAIWFNGATRDKLIAERSQRALELKRQDAKKSKEAAFAPKGKADIDTKDMSLREELEMRFAALGNDDF